MATVTFSEKFNNAFTTIADASITDSVTTINVTSAAALGLDNSTVFAYLTLISAASYRKNPLDSPETSEIVLVTAVSGDALTVTRGVDGSAGTAFIQFDIVEARNNVAHLEDIQKAITDGTDDLFVNIISVKKDVEFPTNGTGFVQTTSGASNANLDFDFSNDSDKNDVVRFFRTTTTATGAGSRSFIFYNGTGTSTITIDAILGAITIAGEMESGGAFGCPVNAVTGDGTTTVDWGATGNYLNFTFGAQNDTFTFTAPSNPGWLVIKLIQDSVGSRTATWPATVKWPGGSAPTLTTTGTTGTDLIRFYYDGTNYNGTSDLNYS